MAKLILTADEELQYLRELDRMQDIMPEIEIQVISEPVLNMQSFTQIDRTIGDEFRTFLRANNLKVSMSEA